MPNYIVIEIQSNGSLTDLANSVNQATKPHESVNAIVNALTKRNGVGSGTIKVVTKDATTTINTSGSGSVSNVFTF